VSENRILLVDDEPDLRYVVSFELTRAGYAVTAVASGDEALEIAACQAFDLVITDLKMPGMDGVEMLARLRRLRPELRMIVASGWVSPEKMAECRSLGASSYLCKPFELSELLGLVDGALGACARQT
jgi:CheY-like chemotaxis protein